MFMRGRVSTCSCNLRGKVTSGGGCGRKMRREMGHMFSWQMRYSMVRRCWRGLGSRVTTMVRIHMNMLWSSSMWFGLFRSCQPPPGSSSKAGRPWSALCMLRGVAGMLMRVVMTWAMASSSALLLLMSVRLQIHFHVHTSITVVTFHH